VLISACGLAVRATRSAINTLGGHGFLTDHPVERWFRAAVTLAAVDFDPLLADLEL
jgi:alkylation response protein AidB-like acyl-CoA dehydrogenase